jgi:hypothetical protein
MLTKMANHHWMNAGVEWRRGGRGSTATIDVSYAAPQAYIIINVALHREYSPGIIFIFSQGRKDLYHV